MSEAIISAVVENARELGRMRGEQDAYKYIGEQMLRLVEIAAPIIVSIVSTETIDGNFLRITDLIQKQMEEGKEESKKRMRDMENTIRELTNKVKVRPAEKVTGLRDFMDKKDTEKEEV
jgi:hypothetical protein